jgi:hypothetical protein
MFYSNVLLSWYLGLWFSTALLSYSKVCLLLHYVNLDPLGVVGVFDSVGVMFHLGVGSCRP